MNNSYKLVLATDLDGTFLEGEQKNKEIFYNELVQLQDEVMLIYVTGRPIEAVKYFCKNNILPFPHFVLGDHGTHIVEGTHFQSIDNLQTDIIKKWNNANTFLKELLSNELGIQLQPINPPYRVAYYYAPEILQETTLQKIADAGFDAILSCEMYLDIVPQGVNKGSSLLSLLQNYSINHNIVITCGDSLNDLPLFKTGLKSIAVGNSEPKLIQEISLLKNVFYSSNPGILGIIEGLSFYNVLHLFKLT